MKCSKCGKEIRNLPEYIVDIGAEVLCSDCAGTAERTDDALLIHTGGFRSFGSSLTESSDGELDIAA